MNTRTVLIVFLVLVGWSCNTPTTDKKARPVLEVGYQNSPIASLLMVGKDRGFFDSAGVTVNMHGYSAGKFAVTDLTSGKGLDIALSGELPLVYASMQGHKVRIISQVVESTTNECRIIARHTGTPVTAEQYFSVPRTIVTSKKGTPEYFLHQYIAAHRLDTSKLTIVGMKPEEMVSTLVAKGCDAICIFDPTAALATREMRDEAIVFQDSSVYSALYIISVMEPTLKARRSDLIKFVQALNRAAEYITLHPDEAKKIVAKYTMLDADIMYKLWGNYDFGVAFTPALPMYLSAEAQWAKQSGDTAFVNKVIPDFKSMIIDTSVLNAVAPDKITMSAL